VANKRRWRGYRLERHFCLSCRHERKYHGTSVKKVRCEDASCGCRELHTCRRCALNSGHTGIVIRASSERKLHERIRSFLSGVVIDRDGRWQLGRSYVCAPDGAFEKEVNDAE